jgi:putative ABC transport system permease protein
MLKSYLLVALRLLRRQPGYAILNVAGLGIGVACCLLIALFVRNELAFDRHHEHGERIVRLGSVFPQGTLPVTASAAGPVAVREVPAVEASVRLFNVGQFQSVVVAHDERTFEESRFFYADSTVFDVFTLPMTDGDPATALTRPRTVVLSEQAARRYFPDADARGKTILVDGRDFEVTGVLAPIPASSHLQFDFLASFTTLRAAGQEVWHTANFYTYLLLREGTSTAAAAGQIERVVDQGRQAGVIHEGFGLALQPLRTIHLDLGGRRTYVFLFSAIAALILLIACVNYMNLSTARATGRAKEVGVRKVTGAGRRQIVGQFYGESAVLVALSLVLAFGLAVLFAPLFGMISGQPVAVGIGDPFVLGGLALIGVIVTLVAGSYPALLLSSFQPAHALKGTIRSGRGAITVRRGLVTFQFAVSVFLLVGTGVVYGQLRFIEKSDPGFHAGQVVALPIGDPTTRAQLPTVKQRLEGLAGVEHMAVIDRLPGSQSGGYRLEAEGFQVPDGMDYFPVTGVPTEAGVAAALGIEMLAGSDLRMAAGMTPSPGEYGYLVNEALIRATGWTPEEAIGKRMTVSGEYRAGAVVGVFRDYHFMPMREAVGPLALFVDPGQATHLLVRLSPASIPATLAGIESIWGDLVPHRPFSYVFLDEAFAAHYQSERQLGRLFAGFSLLAVVIACLGLFGLATYAIERRRKEIGVRKVLGAGVHHVVTLLSREFALLVVIGFVLAVPIAYWTMSRWLEGFAYRIELGPQVFLLAGGLALVLALMTVSFHAVRAAMSDPVRSLRYE